MADVDLDDCPTEEGEDNKKFDNKEEQEQFETCMKILMYIESLEQRFYGGERDKFKGEIYFFVEHTVYTLFDVKSGDPIFPEGIATNIIYTYQTLVDYVYLYEKPEIIKQSVEFSIYYLLTPGEEKEELLESMVNMNVLMSEMFLMNEHYLRTLINYSDKRNPSIAVLKKLYDKFLQYLLNYYIIDGIGNQWKKVFSFKRPERWMWVFMPLVNYLANTSIKDILGILEGFTNDERIDKEETHENFFGGIGKIGKAFAKLPEFLGKAIKLVSNILNPFKLLEVIAKFIIILILIILKLILFSIPIGEMYIGEFIIAIIVGIVYSILYVLLFAISYTFTFIMRHTDVYTGGFVYRFFYWMFGASENAPAAWYKRSGHHYGMHTCKSMDDDDDNNTDDVEEFKQENVIEGFSNKKKCKNNFQNKVNRMFLAYYPCSNKYKPDTELNGLMCARNLFQEPSHCLQSNIYRYRNNLKIETPIIPGRFAPTVEFTKSLKSKRKKIISQFKNMKKRFYFNCEASMKKYDPLTKNVCRMYAGLDGAGRNKDMDALCYNAYCTNGTRNTFCNKLTEAYIQNSNEKPGIVSRMFVLFIYVIITSFIISKMTSL